MVAALEPTYADIAEADALNSCTPLQFYRQDYISDPREDNDIVSSARLDERLKDVLATCLQGENDAVVEIDSPIKGALRQKTGHVEFNRDLQPSELEELSKRLFLTAVETPDEVHDLALGHCRVVFTL